MADRGAKGLLSTGLHGLGAAAMLRRVRQGLRVVLYHHVGEPCEFTRHLGCVTPERVFREHLEWLRRRYQVVSLEEVVDSERLPRNALLITFDDAYNSVASVAGPILKELDLPSVLFLATAPVFDAEPAIDNLASFAYSRYPEEFRRITQTCGASPVAQLLLRKIPAGSLAQREELRSRLESLCGNEARREILRAGLYLTIEAVRGLDSLKVSLARHTHSHVNLRLLEDPAYEVSESWTQCALPDSRRAFSFPFGSFKDAGPEVLARLRGLDIGPLFLVEGCANLRSSSMYYRTSPVAEPVANLSADLECWSLLRRWRKRKAIARAEEEH